MNNVVSNKVNIVLLRGACLWILVTLVLAWCLVGLAYQIEIFRAVFPGEFHRVLQAHIDLLIMSALLLGFYATKIPLPWPTAWAMTIGAFTNSSLFLLFALFPIVDPATNPPAHWSQGPYEIYQTASLCLTTFGFATAAIVCFRHTLRN